MAITKEQAIVELAKRELARREQAKPDPLVQWSQQGGFSTTKDITPVVEFGQQTIGALQKGTAQIGQGLLEAPGQFVRNTGFLRQYAFAEDVLKETDPEKQEQLRQQMSQSKQAFDQVADALDKPAGEYQKGLDDILKNHPEWKHNPPESFVELLTNPKETALSIAESIPVLVGAGIATVSGHPNVGMGMIFATESKQAKDQALQDTGDKDTAALAGTLYGTVSAALEGMQLQGLTNLVKGSRKYVIGRALQKLGEKGFKNFSYSPIKIALQETVEEMSQQGWQEFTAKAVYDKDVPGGLAGFLDRQAQAGYLGFLLSGGASAVGAGIGGLESLQQAAAKDEINEANVDTVAKQVQQVAAENGVSPEYVVGNIVVQREADKTISRFPQKIADQESLENLGLELQAHLAGTEVGKGLNDWNIQWELYSEDNKPKPLSGALGNSIKFTGSLKTTEDVSALLEEGYTPEQIVFLGNSPKNAIIQIIAPTGKVFDLGGREFRPDRKHAGQRARKAGEAFRHTQATVKRTMVHELAHLVNPALITKDGKRIAHTPEFARNTATMTKELFKTVPGEAKPVAEVEQLPQAQAEPEVVETPQAEQPINVYKTESGSRTGITEQEVKYDKETGQYTDTVTGENVILDREASQGALQKPAKMAEAKPSEPKAKKPKKLTKRQAQKLGHSLPKKLGWNDAQRRDFMQELVGRRTMKDMPLVDMNTVVEALQQEARDRGLLPPEDYPKTLMVNGREVPTDEFFENVEQSINDLPDLSQKQRKMRPRRRAERARGFLGSVKAVLTGIDNLSVPHLMRKIGAAKAGMLKEVGVTGWRSGIHQIASVFRGGVDMLNEAADAAGITPKDLAGMSSSADPRMELIKKGRELLGKPKTKEYKIKINGKKFSLEMGELMDMYLASLQDTGPKHIEKGGFEIRGYKTGPISEADMDSIRNIVEADPKALALMNAAIKIADEYNAPQLNYTNGRLNPESPEPIADRKNYWHLESKQPKKVKGKPTYSISLLENKNILKPRTGGKQPLVIRGFFNRFFAVQYAVSEYVGMAEQLRLMNMVLNHGPVMDTLEAKGYTPIRDNLKQLLEWVQSKGSTATTTDKLVGRILHGAFRAVLHYSPEVILSQYMSTGHYMAYADAKYAPLLAVPPTPTQIHEMLDKNPVVWQRYYAGGQSAELAELGQLDVSLRLLTGKHADLNKTGIAAQLTDLAAFCQGWKLAKAIVQDTTNLEVGSPEFFDAVNDKAEELWDTQPSWDKWNKSINTSQRGIRRVPFLFRSYFEKSLMMLHSANATYQSSEKTAGDKAQWAKVYGAILGSQMATALIRTFVGATVWRRRKTVWDFIGAMVAAPLAMVSIVGGYLNRVVGNVFKIMAGEKQGFEGEPISTLPGKTVEEFLIGIGQVTDGVAEYAAGNEDQAKRKLKTGIDNITISVGTFEGIPVRQLRKIERALDKEDGPKMYGGGL